MDLSAKPAHVDGKPALSFANVRVCRSSTGIAGGSSSGRASSLPMSCARSSPSTSGLQRPPLATAVRSAPVPRDALPLADGRTPTALDGVSARTSLNGDLTPPIVSISQSESSSSATSLRSTKRPTALSPASSAPVGCVPNPTRSADVQTSRPCVATSCPARPRCERSIAACGRSPETARALEAMRARDERTSPAQARITHILAAAHRHHS